MPELLRLTARGSHHPAEPGQAHDAPQSNWDPQQLPPETSQPPTRYRHWRADPPRPDKVLRRLSVSIRSPHSLEYRLTLSCIQESRDAHRRDEEPYRIPHFRNSQTKGDD